MKILKQLKEINPDIVEGIENEADALEVLTSRLEVYNRRKLAEISLEKYAVESNFDKAAEDLANAREKLEKEQVNIQSTYITLFSRFKELETKNARLPESFKKLFNEIIESSMPDEEKVKVLYEKYASIQKQLRHTVYMGNKDNPRDNMSNLFAGVSVSNLDKAITNLDKKTSEYEEKAEAFKARIENVAKAAHPEDLGLQKEFIQAEWIKRFPDEVDQLIDKAKDAKEVVRTWKDDLKDLVNEDLRAKIDITTDIPEVIDLIQKEIKKEKDRVDNMKPLMIKAGFDFSTMSFPSGYTPTALEKQWKEEYTKSQKNLSGLTNAKTSLGIPDKDNNVIKKLQTQIDLTKSARQEYQKLLQYMSSDQAFDIIKKAGGYTNIKLEDIISTQGENEGYISYLKKEINKLSQDKTKEAQDLVRKLQQELDTLQIENIYNTQARTNTIAKLNKEFTKTLSDQVRQSQFDIRQAEVDAMEEGFEKERAQLKVNYDRLIRENEERQEEWIKQLREHQKTLWMQENPGKDESQFTQTFTVNDLSAEQQLMLKQYTTMANKYRDKSEKDLLDNMLIKYGDYSYQRLKIEEDFERDITALKNQRNDENSWLVDMAIAEAEKLRDKELANIDTAMTASSSLWGQLFEDLTYRSSRQLKAVAENAKEILDYVTNTPVSEIQDGIGGLTREQLASLKQDVNQLSEAYKRLGEAQQLLNQKNPFTSLISSIQNYKSLCEATRKAQDAVLKAKEKEKEAEKQLNLTKAGQKMGVYSDKDVKNQKRRLKNLKKERQDAEAAADAAEKSALSSISAILRSVDGVGQALSQVGQLFNSLGDIFDNDSLADAGMAISLI
ncbi:MAG: hypothetical protein LIP01_11745, partial [Tannerellaceae bacterium]|nr:hypothetical protein [Tannerellaceae bacterium]